MSVIFGKFGVDLPKPQPCKYFIYYGPRKSKPRLKGEYPLPLPDLSRKIEGPLLAGYKQ